MLDGAVDRAHTSTDRACPHLPEGEGAKARSCRGTPAYPRARCAPVLPLPTLALRGDHGVLQRAAAASPDTPLPVDMSDGTPHPVAFRPWDSVVEMPIDRSIMDTRSVVYPLYGLDPRD
jgi:hypothetical protein